MVTSRFFHSPTIHPRLSLWVSPSTITMSHDPAPASREENRESRLAKRGDDKTSARGQRCEEYDADACCRKRGPRSAGKLEKEENWSGFANWEVISWSFGVGGVGERLKRGSPERERRKKKKVEPGWKGKRRESRRYFFSSLLYHIFLCICFALPASFSAFQPFQGGFSRRAGVAAASVLRARCVRRRACAALLSPAGETSH